VVSTDPKPDSPVALESDAIAPRCCAFYCKARHRFRFPQSCLIPPTPASTTSPLFPIAMSRRGVDADVAARYRDARSWSRLVNMSGITLL